MSPASGEDVLRGTLDMLILRTLTEEAMHGWRISEQIQELSHAVLHVNQGSLYPSLHRLEKKGYLKSFWGTSENNRRARFYRLTRAGRARLREEEAGWERFTAAVNAVLQGA